ncbi:hypothetical protein pb186bvf_003424 [Paramecium bursaria]
MFKNIFFFSSVILLFEELLNIHLCFGLYQPPQFKIQIILQVNAQSQLYSNINFSYYLFLVFGIFYNNQIEQLSINVSLKTSENQIQIKNSCHHLFRNLFQNLNLRNLSIWQYIRIKPDLYHSQTDRFKQLLIARLIAFPFQIIIRWRNNKHYK